MKTFVVLPDSLKREAEKTGILPEGFYSQSQQGAYENQHIKLFYEGDKKLEQKPDFTYWHETEKIDNDTEIW